MTNSFAPLAAARKNLRCCLTHINRSWPIFGAALALALCGPSGVQADVISFQQGVGGYTGTQATAISYDNNGSPAVTGNASVINANYGGLNQLDDYSRDGAGSSIQNVNNILIGFDLSSLAPGTTVTGATLTLYQDYSGGNKGVVNSLYVIAAADAGWTQGTGTGQSGVPGATWNYQDGQSLANWASGPPVAGTGPGLVAGTDYNSTPVSTEASPGTGVGSPDLRPTGDGGGGGTLGMGVAMTFMIEPAGLLAIENWIDHPSQNAGFFLAQPTNSGSVDIFAGDNSNNATSLHPVLTLTTAPAPVPEPASSVLIALGMISLWIARRRRV